MRSDVLTEDEARAIAPLISIGFHFRSAASLPSHSDRLIIVEKENVKVHLVCERGIWQGLLGSMAQDRFFDSDVVLGVVRPQGSTTPGDDGTLDQLVLELAQTADLWLPRFAPEVATHSQNVFRSFELERAREAFGSLPDDGGS